MTPKIICLAALTAMMVTACTGESSERSLGPACRDGLAAGNQELKDAKARGLSGAVGWTKAASLLAAAKLQQQFEEYQNCVVKVREARGYIREL
ncbi:MAG: hypothetical protein AAF557_09015 [Pseudomonadota bacterium]